MNLKDADFYQYRKCKKHIFGNIQPICKIKNATDFHYLQYQYQIKTDKN